jgi:desulfoferrodoxin-like iron-binding protein
MSGSVYQCWGCGNVVKLLVPGGGDLTCCGAPLKLLGPGRVGGFREKDEPPLDLRQVISDGKAFWEFFESGERPRVGDKQPAWEGDSAGLGAFDFFTPVRG